MDKCTIDSYSELYDNSTKELVKTYTSGSEIACGYSANPGAKRYGENTITQTYNAIFRIADSQMITSQDRLTITNISGSVISPTQYDIVSIQQGKLGILIIGCMLVQV
jgi:hypothetical protein